MSPTTIPQFSIHNILQYISPPSHLLEPIPQHLLSKALNQRHHFLNIHPSSSQEYLCWPSPNTNLAIHLLESFVRPLDDDEYATFPVYYSSDGEYLYAHVHVCSGALRIVFQWDEPDDWKFHDANIMPFPHGSHKYIQDAISECNDLNQAEPTEDRCEEVDAYWNAYGQTDHVKDNDLDSTDDCYWAQYGVEGSGDSTQCSPCPYTRRESSPPNGVDSTDSASDPVIEFSHPSFHFRSPIYGPSPGHGQPTDRLSVISPHASYPLLFNDSDSTLSLTTAEFKTVLDTNSHSASLNIKDMALACGMSKLAGGSTEDDESLRQSIRSILQLWKAGRRKHRLTSRQEEDDLFLCIVREIVEES